MPQNSKGTLSTSCYSFRSDPLARSTLTDINFVRTLHNNDIVVWGGDVRDKEAWSGKPNAIFLFTAFNIFF